MLRVRNRTTHSAAEPDISPAQGTHSAARFVMSTGGLGRLPHLGVLQFTGADALQFLQGQLSNDTQRLAERIALLAAYSSAQGRVLALIYLLPHSSGVLGLLPRDILKPTLERMRKFILRAKVQIEDLSDSWAVAGRFGAQSSAGYVECDGIGTAPVGRDPSRSWVVGPAEAEAPSVENAWRLADIRAGLPQIYAATSEAFVAQMLNLDLLDAISFTKGCYTGQEIIARTQHLGRIKRRLFRVSLPAGDWAIGQPVSVLDRRQGRLVEVGKSPEGTEGLAVLNVEPSSFSATDAAGGTVAVPATELPLPYRVP